MPLPLGKEFANVEDNFDVLPAGTYDAVVFSGTLKEAGPNAKHPGKQYVAWEFNITQEGFEKRKAWMNSSLVPEALPMFMRFLKAVGYDDAELRDPEFELDIQDVCGRPCKLVIVNGTNPATDEPNHSVKRVLPPSATTSSDLP